MTDASSSTLQAVRRSDKVAEPSDGLSNLLGAVRRIDPLPADAVFAPGLLDEAAAAFASLSAAVGPTRSTKAAALLALLDDLGTAADGKTKRALLEAAREVAQTLTKADAGLAALVEACRRSLSHAGRRAVEDGDLNRAARSSVLVTADMPMRQLGGTHSVELERALDREASLQASNDVLTLRLQRSIRTLRTALDELAAAKRDHGNALLAIERQGEQTAKTAASAAAAAEAQRQQQLMHHLSALSSRVRTLGRSTAYLGQKLRRAELPVQYEIADELERHRQESVHLNPRLLAARRSASRSKAVDVDRAVKLIADSKLFDASYYASQLADRPSKDMDLIRHYVTRGWLAGADPNPLFSVRFYLMRNPDLIGRGLEPLLDYIERGSAELCDPHPAFVARFYASVAGSEPAAGTTWLRHFLRLKSPSLSPHPLFDPEDYAKRAGLRESHAAVALLHYLLSGWKRDIAFGTLFDAVHYRGQIGGDAVQTEPYGHYVVLGAPHGLSPHPAFDPQHYLSLRPSVDPRTIDPLVDYVTEGEAEGASPGPFFDPLFYRTRFMKGITAASALEHYLRVGSAAGHDPHPDFDSKAYRQLLPEGRAVAPDVSTLEHFLTTGLFEIAWDRLPSSEPDIANRLVPSAAQPAPTMPMRHYPGKAKLVDAGPTILVVAHAAAEHLFGGERSFLDMLDGIGHLPANLVVALPRNVPNYTNAVRALCRDVFVFDYRWWRKGEASSSQVRDAFRNIIVEHGVSAVHVNTIMLREPLEAAKACSIPGVVHVRELIGQDAALQDLIGQAADVIVGETKRRADWIIGNSNTTAAAFEKTGRTFVVPNPIDIDRMDLPTRPEDREVRFGLISSNIPKKGLSDVVRLAQLAVVAAPSARFVIIGPDTELVRDLKHQQVGGTVPANIVFAGYAATPQAAIEQVDVVLNFSHFAESFGRTVLEAMAARRPVIAFEWGAIPELVHHGETGYLVAFRKPELALDHVRDLCADRGLIRRLGQRGREVAVARYGLASYRDAFGRAYSSILRADRPTQPKGPAAPLVKSARKPGLSTVEPELKLAYFCWHFPVPSETFVLSELEALVADGTDVIVFCRQSPHKSFKPGFDIAFERVDSPDRLAQRLRETGRTMVHAHFTFPTVTDMVWPACELAAIPFTFMAHAQDIFRYDNAKKARLGEIGASRWCRRLFTLSRFHLDYLVEQGFPRDKIVINPNAVDTRRFAAAACKDREQRGTRRIIAISRFVEKKGIEVLIEAAALIADLDVRIDIFGYGEREAIYRQKIADLGLSSVTLHGPLPHSEVVGAMGGADLFACPSMRTSDGDMDGIPTSLVESMAAGLPVLSTAISGIPDLVVDGVTGIVAEPTPASIAAAIRRFYALPDLKVRAIIAAARERAVGRHSVERATRVLKRVWRNQTIDIVAVAWNNIAELKTVVRHVLDNTSLPYHLIICDNHSEREPVPAFLDGLWMEHDHVTVIHNHRNAMVGPGTNLALEQGSSDVAIYICGKECVSFAHGWEIPFVHALEDNPKAGLVGSIGHSPTYLTGAQYPTGIKLFPKFRNRDFATAHPDRIFGHVQGGLFGVRRAMVEAIGGYSEEVPHDYTDVEYSLYAESRGWMLGEVPGVLALFNKSRPTLSQRFDDGIVVAHPVMLDEIDRFSAVVKGSMKHCIVCDWFGPAFDVRSTGCPQCLATPEDRSLYRWLSQSTLMHRRLPTLGVGLSAAMEQVWSQQFQGPRLTTTKLSEELARRGRLPNRPDSLDLSLIRYGPSHLDTLAPMARELKRLLRVGAVALFQFDSQVATVWDGQRSALVTLMEGEGFSTGPDALYASRSADFSCIPITSFRRLAP